LPLTVRKTGQTFRPQNDVSEMSVKIDLFNDVAAILNSIVSNSYYGVLRGKYSPISPPEHPIMSHNNRNQIGCRVAKKVY